MLLRKMNFGLCRSIIVIPVLNIRTKTMFERAAVLLNVPCSSLGPEITNFYSTSRYTR
jgi:hypothetical protein